jgi:hypothetical protein
MSGPPESIDAALTVVQRLIRTPAPHSNEVPVGFRFVGGSSSASLGGGGYTFYADMVAAVEQAAVLLAKDVRFEHIDDLEKEVWNFADQAFSGTEIELVSEFIARNAHEVLSRI